MKFVVERDLFFAAMTRSQRIVERRNTIPILANALLSVGNGRLSLRTTDLDVEIADSIPIASGDPGATTIPVHMLHEIIKKLPSGSEISFELNETKAVVKCGRSRFTINTLPAADYPDITAGDMTNSFALPAATLRRLFDRTGFAMSTEETRYYLNGAYFQVATEDRKPMLRAVATDGHRLALSQVEAPNGSAGMPGVIVPRKTVNELLKLTERVEDDVTVELSQGKIRLTIGDVVLTSKLIDGTYPDYQRVIPVNNELILELDKGDFQASIDRVSTIASDRSRAVKLSLDAGRLTLTATDPDAGTAVEEMDAVYDGPVLDIGFNARYMLDIVAQLDGETATVKLAEATAPALLAPKDDTGSLFVLMPMRV